MRFCCLGSGSRGNAYIVEHRDTTLLVDCGFSLPQLKKRLATRRLSIAELDAVIITHEHRDHICGLPGLLAARPLPLYMTAGTAQATGDNGDWKWTKITSGHSFHIGDLSVHPVTVPHDAAEPVQFVIEDGARRLGLFTDIGHISAAVFNACSELNALVIESNYHLPSLLANRNYPYALRQRIRGDYGHLDNDIAARLVADINDGNKNLTTVVAAHLSENNNDPSTVLSKMRAQTNLRNLHIAHQQHGTDWLYA